jgi:hypothetical protein
MQKGVVDANAARLDHSTMFDQASFAATMTPDLRNVYLGSLMGHTLPSFSSPVAGLIAHRHRHA